MNEGLILENFNAFITENAELFDEAATSASVITDEVTYDSYKNKLLEGIEESEAKLLNTLFDRQRNTLIQESSSLMNTADAITYAVASFPMLVDIYSDPLLSKIVNVFPHNGPTLTIPRLKWISKVTDHMGKVTEIEFPTATKQVRVGHELITFSSNANAFTELFKDENGNVTRTDFSQFRLNKRNFKVVKVKVNDGVDDFEVDMIAVADARGNFVAEDLKAGDIDFKIQGQINFEAGDITWSPISLTAGSTLSAVEATAKIRINGVGNGLAVTKGRPKQNVIDVNCDIEDSFEIENIEEVIQDWKSLYNLDIMSQIKEYVKDQIKLNRDYEIADLLESNIPACKKAGHYREVDFGVIGGTNGVDTKPATVQDIFINVVPVIVSLMEQVRKSTRMEMKYMVTGIDVAAILKSLQTFAVKFDKYEGTTGFSGTTGDMSKLEIITSHAVGNEYAYMVPKSETLSQSCVVEISYKPLYVITETTDSVKRSFIKSRNWIGIVRGEAIATIKFKNYEKALGLS